MKRFIQGLFVLIVMAALAQAAWHHQHLPERVATHFDQEGHPDDWSSRDTHIAFQVGIVLGIAGLMLVLARFNIRLPDKFINIPHREYWLAPARRAATCDWIAGILLAIGCVLTLFLGFVYQQVYEANLLPEPRLALQLLPLIVGLFIFGTSLVVMLMFRFGRPPEPTRRGRRR